jgi:ribonuclease HI
MTTVHKYITAPPGDSGKTRIPDLTHTADGTQTTASTNEEKGQMLAKTFFPSKPSTAAPMRTGNKVKPICKADPLTKVQIRRALARLKPYKAPGPDGIPNIILTKCADILEDRLWHIYSAMWDRSMYFEPWKNFTTIVLRKPGKPRYDTPKAYRPIALLNTLGKVLTSIVAEQLTYYTERYDLLPPLHFGGRPAWTTSDALHFLVHKIKGAWRKKQVTSVLFLDIEGAFPNAVNSKLLSNMVRRKVPTKIVCFVENMLKGRITRLKFDDHELGQININNGIGQGDPLSMVLYQYYNTDLLDIPEAPNETAAAYVDDAILVAMAATFEDTHKILENMMMHTDGAMDWAKEHNSKFELLKQALMDFSHRNKKADSTPLRIANATVEPSNSAKYLGIYLDKHLNWKEQVANAVKKGTKWAAQIKRVVRPGWGLTLKHARRLYISVAMPRILYGVDVWAPPTRRDSRDDQVRGNRQITDKLISVQRPGALAIVGGLRTSPSDSLCVHANITPIHLEIDKQCGCTALRLATLPKLHPLTKITKSCAKREVKRHRSPVHHLTDVYKLDPDTYETIPSAARNPAHIGRQPFKTEIPSTKEASKEADAQAPQHIKIYTESSSHGGNVGAAAILTKDSKTLAALHYRLGTSEEHTVFEAELVGILLRMQLVKANHTGNTTYAIGVDNQAAIKALASKLNKPGHYLAAEVLNTAKKLGKTEGKKYALTIRWTAGHSKIPGNKEVDGEAKKAVEGLTSDAKSLPKALRRPLKCSRSAARQQQQERIKIRWGKEWATSPRYDKMKHIDLSLPSRKFIKLISNKKIHRAAASKFFQLRSGHIPLNAYLHRFKIKESAQCPACGAQRETPQHFIMECPAYAHKRWKLKPKKGRSELKYGEVLGSGDRAIALAHYITDTRRFTQDTQDKQPTQQ